MDIMEYLFDQDNVTRLYGIEQWKIGFEKGLKEAETIENPAERQAYYDKLLKKCKMTKKRHK